MNLLLAILLKNFEETTHVHDDEKQDVDNGIYLKTSIEKIKVALNKSIEKLNINLRYNKIKKLGPTPSENLFK